MSILSTIALSPDGIPLTPDGTHLNWTCKKVQTCDVKPCPFITETCDLDNVDAHKAIFDVLFNVHCSGTIRGNVQKTQRLCCK
jgi:hypothetical protein